MQTDSELTWNDDGHSLGLRIEKTELVITEIFCPNSEDGAKCKLHSEECIVRLFVQRFGLECNVGICSQRRKSKLLGLWLVI